MNEWKLTGNLQRADLYKMHQAGNENLEQMKLAISGWRAWAKEKTKPKTVSGVKKGKETKEVRIKTLAEGSDFAGEEMCGEVTAESSRRTAQPSGLKKMQSTFQEECCTGTGMENRCSIEGMHVTDPMELQRVVLWAEILGEPVSKRRRARRLRGAEGK